MKKIGIVFLTIILGIIMIYFELSMSGDNKQKPKTYYNVYLDGELIGSIKSKKELEKYIDNQNEEYKKKYNVDTIYAPNGLDIKADVVYSNKTEKVQTIYKKIQNKRPFTIKGYQYTVTSSYATESEEDKNNQIKIYLQVQLRRL